MTIATACPKSPFEIELPQRFFASKRNFFNWSHQFGNRRGTTTEAALTALEPAAQWEEHMQMKSIRNAVFVVMVGGAVVGMRTGVLANMTSEFEEFCTSWQGADDYDCQDCELGTGDAPDWGANGQCDFSGIEDEGDRVQTGGAYVEDAENTCWDVCGTEYAQFVADWAFFGMNTTDSCYEAAQDPNNYITWGDAGSNGGSEPSWSCSCQYFMFADC